jgi:hypothetical protein
LIASIVALAAKLSVQARAASRRDHVFLECSHAARHHMAGAMRAASALFMSEIYAMKKVLTTLAAIAIAATAAVPASAAQRADGVSKTKVERVQPRRAVQPAQTGYEAYDYVVPQQYPGDRLPTGAGSFGFGG